MLQQQAETEAAVRRQQAADWAERSVEYREQEWVTAQKLRGAARCFLDMTLPILSSYEEYYVPKFTGTAENFIFGTFKYPEVPLSTLDTLSPTSYGLTSPALK